MPQLFISFMRVQFSRNLHREMMATLSSQTGKVIVLQHNNTSGIVIFSDVVVVYAQNWVTEQQLPGSSTRISKPSQFKEKRTCAAWGVKRGNKMDKALPLLYIPSLRSNISLVSIVVLLEKSFHGAEWEEYPPPWPHLPHCHWWWKVLSSHRWIMATL